MSEKIERLLPDSEPVEPFQPGDQLMLRSQNGDKIVFTAQESETYEDKIELVEETSEDEKPAKSLWSKTKSVSHELYETAIIGEEGKRWRKIVAGITAAATTGAVTYIVIKRHNRGE